MFSMQSIRKISILLGGKQYGIFFNFCVLEKLKKNYIFSSNNVENTIEIFCSEKYLDYFIFIIIGKVGSLVNRDIIPNIDYFILILG